jgi:mannose-6-phosphate isomerase
MPYAWGSRTAIAELTGRTESSAPEAELWMGAHPMAPSRLERGGVVRRLDEVIAENPDAELGAAVHAAFGPRLPFLLKVLAAAQPLSLQAHPTEALAREGFEEEERRGIARDAPTRNYRDPHHKPELVCALTPFDTLSGFRAPREIAALARAIGADAFTEAMSPLVGTFDADGVSAAFRAVMELSGDAVERIVDACREHVRRGGEFREACACAVTLAELYPRDVGVVCALMLNRVRLAPGEAMYLGAGNLHAYLGGVAIEIMASSDNVLRGGLTKKHVDVPELLRVLDFAHHAPNIIRPQPAAHGERTYETPAREFRLSVLELSPESPPIVCIPEGPEILLSTSGRVSITSLDDPTELTKGASVFIGASSAAYQVHGAGTVYRARANL